MERQPAAPGRGKALCTECADLGRLEFLPAGDAAVTRRASKYSTLRAVVVRWSNTRKRYDRQGLLVEPEALLRAEQESLADAEVRARRQARAAERRQHEDRDFIAAFAKAIREQYPGCPANEETQIAEHACRKYSGRVGRTAAAKELSPDAIRLAVIAHIRHAHTEYDELLAKYADRDSARRESGKGLRNPRRLATAQPIRRKQREPTCAGSQGSRACQTQARCLKNRSITFATHPRRQHSFRRKPLPDDSRMMAFVPNEDVRQRTNAHLGIVGTASP